MKFTHFLYCPFTGLGLFNGYRGDAWLANRIKIFNQFVLPSLLNQTNQNFTLWISFRPEEKDNSIVHRFKENLDGIRDLDVVFTYEGIMFYDDKYDHETAMLRLDSSLKKTLPLLADKVKNSEYVYMTIQPSDDMYLSRAVEMIQNTKKNSCFTTGYMMRYDTKEVAEYAPNTVPPFYTLYFRKEDFLNPDEHPRNRSHEDAPVSKYMDTRMFVVGIHGENISTSWNHPFRGVSLAPREQERVLMDTGNYFTEPLIVEKDRYRKNMKRFLNILPLFLQKRIITRLSSKKVSRSIQSYRWFNV